MTQSNKEFQEYLKLMHFTHYNYDQSIMNLETKERLRDIILEEKQSIFSESISDVDSILKKLIDQQEMDIQYLYGNTLDQSFYANCDLILRILANNFNKVDNMLSQVQLSNQSQKFIKSDQILKEQENISENLEKDMKTLQIISECLELTIQKFTNDQFDPIKRALIYDIYHQVGGFVVQFLQNYMNKQQCILSEEKQKLIFKVIRHLYFYLDQNLKHNIKEKFRIISFIYNFIQTTTIYQIYLYQTTNNNTFHSDYYKELKYIYNIFSQCFLQDNKSLNELKEIELKPSDNYIDLFLKIQQQICGDNQQQFINEILIKLNNEVRNIQDCHYYLLYILLTVQKYDKNEDIGQFLQIIQDKQQQLIDMIQDRPKQFYYYFSEIQLIVLESDNSIITKIISVLNEIYKTKSTKINLLFELGKINFYMNQHLKYHNQIEQIVSPEFDNQLSMLNLYLQDTQEIDMKLIISFFEYFTYFYELLNIKQKEILFEIVIKYVNSDQDSMVIFCKLNIKLLMIFDKLKEKSIFLQLLQIALDNSRKNKTNSHHFLVLMSDLIIYSIDNHFDFKEVLLALKLITLSCLSDSDSHKRIRMSMKKLSDYRLLTELFNEYDVRSPELQDGNEMVTYLLFNLSILNDILNKSLCMVLQICKLNDQQIQYLFEIQQEFAFLLYVIYWKLPDRINLTSKSVQECSNQLAYDYYRFSINFCQLISQSQNLHKYIFKIVNSNLLIAYGIEYHRQLTQILFFDIVDSNYQENDLSKLQLHLQTNQCRLQIVFNRYFELAYSILFEVQFENSESSKLFYLTLLDHFIDCSISTVLTFQEILPKFIFYLRIERNQNVLKAISTIIVKALLLNSDNQIIKQLFELFSLNQSTFLRNDIENMRLEIDIFEQIENACHRVNLPPYRIPIFNDIQRSQLIKLADDIKNYAKLTLNILDIIYQTFSALKTIAKENQDLKKLLHFQGCGSYLEIKELKLNSSEFSIKFTVKLFLQSMEIQNKTDDSLMDMMDQSMIQSLDQVTLFILKCGKVTITLYLNSQKSFFLSYKIHDNIKHLKFNMPQSTNLNDWNVIQVEYKTQQFNLIFNKQRLHCDHQMKLDLFNFDKIDSLIIGQKNDDTLFDDKYQNMSKSFMDCSFIQENQYFTGQVHSIQIDENMNTPQNSKSVLKLNLNNLDIHSELFQKKNNFINSQFLLDSKQTSQKKFFEYDEKKQIYLTCESQNVNILDVLSFFEVFGQNNGINLFYLSIDILSIVTQSLPTQKTHIMDCLIAIIKNINIYLSIDTKILKQFILNGQDLFQYQISKWINQCQNFPNQLFQALLEIQENSLCVLKSVVKIMDSPYVPQEYAQELEKIYSRKIRFPDAIYEFLQNLSIFSSVRKSISYLSMQLGNYILFECNFAISTQEYFFSHSFNINPTEIQNNQIQILYTRQWNFAINFQKIHRLVSFISSSCISLTTFDLLQILKLNFEYISLYQVQEIKQELNKNKQPNDLFNKLQDILTNLLQLISKYQQTFKIPESIMQLHNQFYDSFFSLLSYIIIRIKQLQYDLNNTSIKVLDLFQPIQESQVPIGPQMMKVFMTFFNTKQQDSQIEALQKQIIDLISTSFKLQLINDKLKVEVMEFFAQPFKQALRNNGIDNQQIKVILEHPKLNQLVQNLSSSQTIETEQNQKLYNLRNKSYELFTYILTYQMEQSFVCSQKLYKLHFPILNKETFQIFLEITHNQIMQLLANLGNYEERFIEINDEKIYIIKNIITSLLHIEICTQSLSENIRVDFFWKVIDKCMLLFYNLQILKCKGEQEIIHSPCSKYLSEKSDNLQVTEIWLIVEKNEKKLQIPNGGIQRIFIQFISQFIIQTGSAQILEKFINLTDKLNSSNDRKIERKNMEKLNLRSEIVCDKQYIMEQNLLGSNKQIQQQQFPHLIVYQLLVGLEDCDEMTVSQRENIDKVIQLLEQNKKFKEIDRLIEKLQYCQLNYQLDFHQFNNQNQILQEYNAYVKKQYAQLLQDRKKQNQNQIRLPKIQAILQNPTQYSDEANIVKQILHQYVFTPFEFVHQMWVAQQYNYKPENLYEIQAQQSIQSQISQRTNSNTSELKPVQINKMEETWGKISFELKQKNALFYFLEESISILYDEFNQFLLTEEFNLQKLDQVQNKYQVLGLEDHIRRKQQLQQIKLKNTSKPYMKSNQKVQASSKKTINQDSSNEKSPLLSSKQSPLQDSQILYDDDLSLNMSISTLAKQRNSMRCLGNLIQPELIQPSFSGVRKGSEDLMNEDMAVKEYPCEFITQEGAIFGDLQLVTVKKIHFLKFKSSTKTKPNKPQFLIGSVEMIAESKQMTLLVETTKIEYIITRRFILSEVAIEVFFQRQNYFFNLFEVEQRNDFIQKIKDLKIGCIVDRVEEFNKRKYTQKWRDGEISNFEYLMQINTFSGRTYNDLNQYFIFPWILKEFSCMKLDLTKQSNFRNLSKPVGAQDDERFQQIKQRFDQRNPNCDDEYMMYGSHYSNSTIVFNYLLRLEPFNELHYSLQKNKFDVADRLFSSIEVLWQNSRNQDSKELIPEFYYMPEFLQNINKFDFGCMQSKMQVSDVMLPRWVKTKTAEEFVYMMREALECDYVSKNLHNWIDLIFGYQNKGKYAEKANNLFHYLTYEESLKEKISKNDPYLQSYIQQIYFYGQIPYQLFNNSHTQKKQKLNMYLNKKPVLGSKLLLYQNTDSSQIIIFYPFDKSNVYIINSNFTCIQLYQDVLFIYSLANGPQYKVQKITKLDDSDINTTHCNQQNMFTFIYAEGHQFYDKVDSQNHSMLQDIKPYLYLAAGGYQNNTFRIFGVTSKFQGKIQEVDGFKKRVSCLKYHSYKRILVAGSLDNTISVYKIQFKFQEYKSITKCFTISQHRSPISCVDISDLYVLSVDWTHIAYVHTTEGEQLHHLILTNDFQISQCIIHPAQFFIFKTKRSQLHVYTFNGVPYLTNFDLMMEQSQNIVFLAPFSSHFMIFSNTERYIMCYDLFELKLLQQSYTSQLSSVKINLDTLEDYKSKDKQKIKPTQGGVTSFHTVLQTEYIDESSKNYCDFFFLTSLDLGLYWLRDSKVIKIMMNHHLQDIAGLGKNISE